MLLNARCQHSFDISLTFNITVGREINKNEIVQTYLIFYQVKVFFFGKLINLKVCTMSWLNLNDSLNSLKGQISNFANTVLSDEDQGTGNNSPYF